MILDMNNCTLSFKIDGINKGVAVTDFGFRVGEWFPTAHLESGESVHIMNVSPKHEA